MKQFRSWVRMLQKVPCSPAKYSKIDCKSNLIEKSFKQNPKEHRKTRWEKKGEKKRTLLKPGSMLPVNTTTTGDSLPAKHISPFQMIRADMTIIPVSPKTQTHSKQHINCRRLSLPVIKLPLLFPLSPSLSLRSVERIVLWDSSSSSLSIVHHPVCADSERYKSKMPQPELNISS